MIKKQRSGLAGQVRVIGGQWRGRKLPVLAHPALRPTPDRVRETLFNWLAPIIQQANCLDCYAGSGALGLEALSRYAQNATLLEIDFQLADQLNRNLQVLKAKNAEVIHVGAMHWLAEKGEPF